MIVLRVEVWPDGDQKRAREIGVVEIANDETGTADRGNYSVRRKRGHAPDTLPGAAGCYVTGFDRTRRTAWDLAFVALRGLVGRRNP